MIYERALGAVIIFAFFVTSVLVLSFYLGRRAKSAKAYYAASGQIHWFVNGIAFAGDYLSAASFLGICGMISFFGYDGFLYSIGYLAGWIVALFVIAEPLKRMGRYTFADALDNKFKSRGIKLTAAISTLIVSVFYLIPQMVGAGVLVKPLLGFPHHVGVLLVGFIVVVIVVTAGMVSTTYVQFIKGSLLVVFCAILTWMILNRGLTTKPMNGDKELADFKVLPAAEVLKKPGAELVPEQGPWTGKPYVRIKDTSTGITSVWRKDGENNQFLAETQTLVVKDGKTYANGLPHGLKPGEGDLRSIGRISELPGGVEKTGPLGPIEYLKTLKGSTMVLWSSEKIVEPNEVTTVYFQKKAKGEDLLLPGASPTFSGLRGPDIWKKLDFLSLMLALFAGTASLPHILIRYYTVRDQESARKSTVVGIASIGFFYVLTLYLGLGAMTSGSMDPTNNNMAAPLLAKSFSPLLFAIISAIAFTTVLGTVSGLILAASGAVAHDIMTNVLKIEMEDRKKVASGKVVAIIVGIVAMVLGILFEKLNVTFLVGWAFNIAASANLPALIMLLFWSRTTKQGIAAAIVFGMFSSLAWILLSAQAFKDVYGLDPKLAVVPFSQPGLVTIPLGFLVLVIVSLLTAKKKVAVPYETGTVKPVV